MLDKMNDDELNKFRTTDAIEFLRCRNPNGLDDNKCVLIVDYIDTLKAENAVLWEMAIEYKAIDLCSYEGDRWYEQTDKSKESWRKQARGQIEKELKEKVNRCPIRKK